MINSDKSFLNLEELLEILRNFELESADFYGNLAGKEGGQEFQEVFIWLKEEELRHAEALEKINPRDYPKIHIQIPPELSLSMPQVPEYKTLAEILDLAIDREERASGVYSKASGTVPSPLKDLFLSLAEWEGRHKQRLILLKSEIVGRN